MSDSANQNSGELNILVTMTPADPSGTSGNKFASSLAPGLMDYESASATAFSALLGKLASAGQEGAEEAATNLAYARGVDFPIFGLPYMLADAASAYGQDGLWGAIKTAVGDIEAYGTTALVAGSSLESYLVAAAAAIGVSEAGAFAATTLVAIAAGYAVNKAVNTGLDYIATNSGAAVQSGPNQLTYPDGTTESLLANGSSLYVFPDGISYTLDRDGTSSATANGNTYSFDTSGSLSAVAFTNNFHASFSSDGLESTITDSAGISTTLTTVNDGNGYSTLTANTDGVVNSLSMGVDGAGQLTATSGGNTYNFTLTDDSSGDQNLLIQDATTASAIDESMGTPAAPNSYTTTTYNADGTLTQTSYNGDGSVNSVTTNSSGKTIGTQYISPTGTGSEMFYDPTTGDRTAENVYNSDGSQWDYTILSDGKSDGHRIQRCGSRDWLLQLLFIDGNNALLSVALCMSREETRRAIAAQIPH